MVGRIGVAPKTARNHSWRFFQSEPDSFAIERLRCLFLLSGCFVRRHEKGRITWARVKGATENALIALCKHAYMFRPGFMRATPGQKNIKNYYRYISWLYPIGRALYPAGFCTLQEVGLAMIEAAGKGYPKPILEVQDIVTLAAAP